MLIDIPEFFPLALGLAVALVAYRVSAFLKAKTRKLNVDADYAQQELELRKK